MSNPFDGQSPWGETAPSPEAPRPNAGPGNPGTAAPGPAPYPAYKLGITLKAAAGYDAEWLTPSIQGATAEEVATRTRELVEALARHGIIELVSAAAVKMRDTHQTRDGGGAAPKTFQNGRVVTQAPAPAGGTGPTGDSCTHGRTLREGQGARGPWAAMFCNAPKPGNCEPLWRKPDGTFA